MRFATRWKCGCRSADGHASSILSRCRWSDRFRALVGVLSAWGPLATLRVGSPIACRLWLGCCASSAPGPPVALPPKPPPRRHCSHGGRDWPGSAAVICFPAASVGHGSRRGWVFYWVGGAFSCRGRPFSRKRQCVSLTRERLARASSAALRGVDGGGSGRRPGGVRRMRGVGGPARGRVAGGGGRGGGEGGRRG